MGRHADVRRRRGIASWPLVAAGVVVLLVAVAVMYVFVLKDDDGTPQACSGSSTLTVLASAGASPAARALSDAFNATRPSARSTCVTSQVVTAASGDAAGLLADGWRGRTGPPPAVWVTDDASQLAALEKADPSLTAGRDTEPLATSPVVLAVRSDATSALAGKRSWQQFATLFSTGRSAASPRLLAADPRENRGSSYALSSMFAQESAPPSNTQIAAAATTVRAMIDSRSADLATTGDALQELSDGGQGTDQLAVPVTEADLAAFNSSSDSPLTALYPAGPSVGDEVYVIGLTMDGLDDTQRDAATRFHSFARDTSGQQIFSAARMRVAGLATSTSPGIDAATSVTMLPGDVPDLDDAWARALGLPGAGVPPTSSGPGTTTPTTPTPTTTAPTTGTSSPGPSGTGQSSSPRPSTTPSSTPPSSTPPSSTPPSSTPPSSTPPSSSAPTNGPGVTFLADTSATWDTEVSGSTRNTWLQQALTGAVATTGTSRFGLWSTSSTDEPSGYVELAPLAARSSTLDTAIGALGSSGERRYYRAVPAVLQQVAAAANAQSPQRVVLITDGPDQTPSTSRAEVVQAIRDVVATNPSISLDVVGVGENAPDSALVALAAAGNGTYYDCRSTTDLPAILLSVMNGT